MDATQQTVPIFEWKQKIHRDFLILNTFAYMFLVCYKRVANSSSIYFVCVCVQLCIFFFCVLCSHFRFCVCCVCCTLPRYLSIEWKTVLWCAVNYVLGICLHCILCYLILLFRYGRCSFWLVFCLIFVHNFTLVCYRCR